MMKCPCCASELHCDCKSCATKNEGKDKWYWKGDDCYCGVCGFIMHCIEWMEYEWTMYTEVRDE